MHERAAAQGMSTAAFVRQAVLACARQPTSGPLDGTLAAGSDERLVKVTVRLPAAHAVLLATRARRAEVSRGAFVAALLEGTPPPAAPPARAETLAALLRSNDRLAVLGADLQSLLRLLRQVSSAEFELCLEPCRAGVMRLAHDVREHLDLAARVLAVSGTNRGVRQA